MKRKKLVTILLICLILVTFLISSILLRKKNSDPVMRSTFLLDTIVSITLYGEEDEKLNLIEGAFALCREYEQLFSRTIETSDISRINNRSSSSSAITVAEPTAELLRAGLEYSILSDGAFDITIGGLTSLWDFQAKTPSLPSDEEIRQALSLVGFEKLHVDGVEVLIDTPGTALDTGAIAKGYIADRLKEYLISEGETSGVISLGGNILVIGSKPDGNTYKIGIQKPFEDRNETIASVEIRDMSVVSSGIYERNFTIDGKNYHHILNPATGYPYENGLVSVTILSPFSIDGDALSTVCFSLGLQKGMELVNSMPDIHAVFITDDYVLHYSEEFPLTDE